MSSTARSGTTVAVTGAAGYIGSRVVWQLRRDHPDWSVVALDNFYLGEVSEIAGVTVQDIDIRDRDRLEATLADADVVIHLAAISGVDDCTEQPNLAYEVNALGTMHVAWHCRQTGTPLVFPFSMAVVGDPPSFPIDAGMPRDPLNWYGETKVIGERAIETMAAGSFPAHLFMISNLYGAHEIGDREVSKGTVINYFVDRALAGESITVYEPGTQSRNFVHVKDVANALCLSAERLADGPEGGVRKFELASDQDPSVQDVGEMVARLAADRRGLAPAVTMVENPRGNETLVERFDVSTSKIRDALGWRPTRSIEQSIERLLSNT
jgi:nucleoside-diphosphate-sugar epimerase